MVACSAMTRPTGPIPGPMTVEALSEMCSITRTEGDIPVYPTVDDKHELQVGDVVFAEVKLEKKEPPGEVITMAMPGVIYTEAEHKLAIKLWFHDGQPEEKKVKFVGSEVPGWFLCRRWQGWGGIPEACARTV